MPKLSEFFGIAIYMYWGDHGPPHFHARYGGEKASIAIGDLDVKDTMRACRKEILVAIANGIASAILAGSLAYLWKGNLGLAVVLGAALVLSICAATMAGVLIPLGLKAMKIDPAVSANIFVTTVTDVMGFLFFLGLGALALEWIT